jgi:hypothetical protein
MVQAWANAKWEDSGAVEGREDADGSSRMVNLQAAALVGAAWGLVW